MNKCDFCCYYREGKCQKLNSDSSVCFEAIQRYMEILKSQNQHQQTINRNIKVSKK